MASLETSQPPTAAGRVDGDANNKANGALPAGSILSGKQEHYLKRELINRQTHNEIMTLNSPTALQRFGAPFRSDAGEVAPADSELPILRFIFVHHVRNFPFLDQAREEEFWQDKLQAFLESFAKKNISSSEDRLEETKRRKLAQKAEKLVELMMVSGIPTASGYEERIRFAEMEVVDRGANEQGLVANTPEGAEINSWDVNVAGVRTTAVKRTVRYHHHAEFLLRVKERGKPEKYVGRRFGQFVKMHKQLKLELPGKVLPPLPRKNRSSSASYLSYNSNDDASSISSASTQDTHADEGATSGGGGGGGGFRSYLNPFGGGHARGSSVSTPSHSRNRSTTSIHSQGGRDHSNSIPSTPDRRKSTEQLGEHVTLYREAQRVSLRAYLRNILQNERVASSKAMRDFLTRDPITLNREEEEDLKKRKSMDEKRVKEQKEFYEIARKRAHELDEHMEKFRRDIVERNGLSKLFKEIREKDKIADLSPEYQKFAEWLRIEVAATLYHIFLAEDNSPELFAQAKRIHSLVPYVALKNVIRFANPAAVMKGVLDLFLAQPLGTRSLMQRIFSMALNDGVRQTQKSIDALNAKIKDDTLSGKIQRFVTSEEDLKEEIHTEAELEQVDIIVAILRSDQFQPELEPEQIGTIFNAYVAWNNAVDNIDDEMKAGAELFANLKALLKLYTRQRDKNMMMSIIEEPVTLQLFRDLFTIFYEPLVRVYKSANVYSSVTDFSAFADDAIGVIESAQRQDVSADPNQTVQAFIDLCARHEDDLYKFIHEVHIHDNGLFDQLMGWLEGILEFLRHGPKGGKLDMNALFQGAVDMGTIDKDAAIKDIDALVAWQTARKQWHNDKTRRKMAAEGSPVTTAPGGGGFRSSDFGINELDIQDLGLGQDDDEESYINGDETMTEDALDELENTDPIAAERRRRKKVQMALKSRAGEPEKPDVTEVPKMMDGFVGMLRMVLAE